MNYPSLDVGVINLLRDLVEFYKKVKEETFAKPYFKNFSSIKIVG